MTETATHSNFQDRRVDFGVAGLQEGKPPILRRVTLRRMSVAALAIIIYGTLGPLGLSGGSWLSSNGEATWILLWQHCDKNDIFTNFAVYFPVGMALRLLMRRRGRAGAPDFLAAMSLSLVLSYVTEYFQQYMPARSSNLCDVVVNGFGAFAGCLAAPHFQHILRAGHIAGFRLWNRSSWTILAIITGLITTLLMTIPFRIAFSAVEVELTRPLDLVDVERFGMFAAFGFCLMAAAVQRDGDRMSALRAVVPPIFAFATWLEGIQLFLSTHACGLLDILIAFLGGLAGCGAALRFVELDLIRGPEGMESRARLGRKSRLSPRLRRVLALGALAATILCIVTARAARFGGLSPYELPSVRWLPFQAHFMLPFHRMIDEIVGSIALYGVLSILCLALTYGCSRLIGLYMLLGVVGGIECCYYLLGHTADMTALLLAFVAWALTVGIWAALTPQPRSVVDESVSPVRRAAPTLPNSSQPG